MGYMYMSDLWFNKRVQLLRKIISFDIDGMTKIEKQGMPNRNQKRETNPKNLQLNFP